jgi:phosphonate transport system permease protein
MGRRLFFFVASLILVAFALDLDARALFDGAGSENALEVLRGFAHPDLRPETLERIAGLALESVAIGVAGTSLALVFGIALALLAARVPQLEDAPGDHSFVRGAADVVRRLTRVVLLFFRSIPEIVWAYLFVRIFGLGAGPAVLAIAITFSGILGKLYAELLEAVDPRPIVALRATGTGWLGALFYGALPQVRAEWTRYALFRLECGVRSGTILGVVGAGGLGMEIDLAIRYLEYETLATCLLVLLLIVGLVEAASGLVHRLRSRVAAYCSIGLAAASLFVLDFDWGALVSWAALDELLVFASSFGNPSSDSAYLWTAMGEAIETVAMAWLATGAVSILSLALAPLAVRSVLFGWLAEAPPLRVWRRAARWLVLFAARGIFQLSRTLPEIVWALLFVVWVGPGVLACVLAIAAHTFGILGRLFAEVIAETDPESAEALEASGASAFGLWIFGVLPNAFPRLAAYALFRFEVNVRITTMVGFVGAGGIGDALHTAISLFHFRDLAALLLVLLGTVAIIDAVGDRIRSRLLVGFESVHPRDRGGI